MPVVGAVEGGGGGGGGEEVVMIRPCVGVYWRKASESFALGWKGDEDGADADATPACLAAWSFCAVLTAHGPGLDVFTRCRLRECVSA